MANLLVVAIEDSAEAMQQFMAADGFIFPVLLDPGQAVGDYGIQVIPTIVVINSEGRIRETVVGTATAEDLVKLVAAFGN